MAAAIGDSTAYHLLHLKIHIDQTISCLGIIYDESLDYLYLLLRK